MERPLQASGWQSHYVYDHILAQPLETTYLTPLQGMDWLWLTQFEMYLAGKMKYDTVCQTKHIQIIRK